MRAKVSEPVRPGTLRERVTELRGRIKSAAVTTDSAMLFANTLISAALGVLFWTVAARLYDVAAVGFTSAVVSATTLIATLANVGLGPIALRYLPVAGARKQRLALIATIIPAMIALVVTTILATVPAAQTIASELQGHDLVTVLLPIALAIATAIMLVQDSICIAQRRTSLVLIRGVGSALVRFALLIPCAQLGPFGLVAAFTAGVLAAVVLGAGVWRKPTPIAGELPDSVGKIAVYGATNYVSGIFSQTPQLLYPILIARDVSHAAAGAFAFVWMASSLLMALSPSVANVLLTRLSLMNRADQDRQIRNATRAIVGVCAALACAMFGVVALFARIVLPAAASDIQAFLPIVLASSVLYAIVRLQSMQFALRAQMRQLLVLNGSVALVAVVLPVLLLPRFGVQGLEAGWLLSQGVGVALGVLLKRFAHPTGLAEKNISQAGSREDAKTRRGSILRFWEILKRSALGILYRVPKTHSNSVAFTAKRAKSAKLAAQPDHRTQQSSPSLQPGWKKDIPMLDLIMALILFLVPVGLAQLGVPQVLLAALSTGSILIWPGYIFSRLLWKQRRPNIYQQLALIPLMSTLLIVIISLSAWAALGPLDGQLVYVGALVVMALVVIGQLLAGFRQKSQPSAQGFASAIEIAPERRSADRPPTGTEPAQHYHAFSGAFVMFAVLAALVGLAVGWPQASVQAGQMALYLDPQAAPAFNNKSLDVPLVLTNPARAAATQIELRAEFMGAVVVQQVALAPGEQRQVTLRIPSPRAAHDAQPIDIRARSLDVADTQRQLRFWLKPDQK